MTSRAPATVGIGLRHPHYQAVLEQRPALGFLEVHSENFFHAGGASLHVLERARAQYPISLHGVGLSLASADAISNGHLSKLEQLTARIEPALVSEHLCWGAIGGKHFNDLLPFPYTAEALTLLSERVDHVQNTLKRTILIENLSAYLQFRNTDMDEFAFLAELSQRTGCGILLDVNNLYVNANNFAYDPWPLIEKLPIAAIGEIHLAGHSRSNDCLIDTHSDVVCEGVWDLYRRVLNHAGSVPTLIEWDTDIPPLEVLLEQASMARECHAVGGRQSADNPLPFKGRDGVGMGFGCTTLRPIPLPTLTSDLAPVVGRLVEWQCRARPLKGEEQSALHKTQTTFGAALLSSKLAESAAPMFVQLHDTAIDRLAIYRGNVVAAVTKALQAAYPVIEKIVGAEFFAALARAYWQEHPSRDGDLHLYGASFAQFAAAFPHTQEMPYLPDVAQVEWAVHRAYGAADHAPLALNALAEISPGRIGELQFEFQPAAALFDSAFPIAAIWQQHQPDYPQEIDIDLRQPQAAAAHRRGDRVTVTALTRDQFQFLQQLQQGEALQSALLNTLESHPQFAIDQALALAFNNELITSLRREGHGSHAVQ